MQRLGKIIYDAIMADTALRERVDDRVKSTCFEVAPDEQDNTPLPYIVVRDTGISPSESTKDEGWMPSEFACAVGVEVGGNDSNEVWEIELQVMKAIGNHMTARALAGQPVPYLKNGYPKTVGIAWDWTKPCYFDIILYLADQDRNNEPKTA